MLSPPFVKAISKSRENLGFRSTHLTTRYDPCTRHKALFFNKIRAYIQNMAPIIFVKCVDLTPLRSRVVQSLGASAFAGAGRMN